MGCMLSMYCCADFFNGYPQKKEKKTLTEQNSFMQLYESQPNKQTMLSVSSVLSGINMITLGYVCFTLYKRYQCINVPLPQQNNINYIIYTAYAKAFPGLVRLSANAHFCIDATLVALEAFMYKTMAQLIVLCCCCDVTDIFEMGIKRTKNMVKNSLC